MPRFNSRVKGEVISQCPFYKSESRKTITCEGFLEGTDTMTRFQSEDEKDKHIVSNCAFYPNECLMCQVLLYQYS